MFLSVLDFGRALKLIGTIFKCFNNSLAFLCTACKVCSYAYYVLTFCVEQFIFIHQ
uniref:Uncharacterized protein n=1 Tax=Anguilla anguilla TaxID=7936 RepID=A0A0E9X1J2_ANGAN